MNIFFFHGKLSTPETSQTAKAVVEYFTASMPEDTKIFVPDYKPNEREYPVITYHLLNYIKDRYSSVEENIFIGISLGGYWALEMANLFPGSICILLNPSLNYYKIPWRRRIGLPLTVVLNADDELLDSAATAFEIGNRADVITFATGGHRMNNIKEVLPIISKAVYREAF
jgi:predicted esterase YcpF (UPF0227 family)